MYLLCKLVLYLYSTYSHAPRSRDSCIQYSERDEARGWITEKSWFDSRKSREIYLSLLHRPQAGSGAHLHSLTVDNIGHIPPSSNRLRKNWAISQFHHMPLGCAQWQLYLYFTVPYISGVPRGVFNPPPQFWRYRWSPRSHKQEEPASRFPFVVHCVLIRL